MKKSPFSESQIISILNKQEQGLKVRDICREHGISNGPAMLMGLEIFKHCRVKINYSTNQLIICQ